MKHAHPFLLLALLVLLCKCTKHSQPEPDIAIDKNQAAARESKLSKISNVAENDSATLASPIPQKFFDEVAELTRPLQEQLKASFEELNADLYDSYQKDLQIASEINFDADREKFIINMKDKYYAFLLEGWTKAGIDNEAYKKKITSLLPRDLRELIRFDGDFLNFYFDILRPPGSTTWIPRMKDIDRWEFDDDDAPAPPKPPVPACQLAEGKTYYPNLLTDSRYVEKFLSADADGYNLYSNGIAARANTWPVLGRGLGRITLVSNMLPESNACTKLKVRKTINWKADLYAFTFYGHLTVSTAEYNTGFTSGNVTAVAPLIWFHERNASRTIEEEYTIAKNDYRIQFGANVIATVTSEGVFSNGSTKTSLTIPSWSLTELCCK
ncbi:MAG TPA: hypothetical protein VL943_07960 [Niabella sp.]|nr:hypothetical protein [Niabella sp.]